MMKKKRNGRCMRSRLIEMWKQAELQLLCTRRIAVGALMTSHEIQF